MPSSVVIDITEKALPDLKRIAELEENIFGPLLAAIAETAPTLTFSQFDKKLSEKLPLVKHEDVAAVLSAAFTLYGVMRNPKTAFTPQELAERVANAPVVTKAREFSPELRARLSDRLSRILSFPKTLGVTSKALDVMTEHDRIFCSARILSDIRPVFGETPDVADAAAIIHTLQIGFHQNGAHHEFYVALDTSDIQKLRDVIDRADKKTSALRSILSKSNISYLEV